MSDYISTFRWPIDPQALAKVKQVAKDIGIPHDFLMGVMTLESNLNPQARNKYTKATGLIQFLPSTAVGLGTTIYELQKMNFIEQMDWVKKYFLPYVGDLNTLEDVYMAVLYPAAIGKGPNHVLFQAPSTAYTQNAGLDTNNDGKITVGDATRKVREKMKLYQIRAPLVADTSKSTETPPQIIETC